MIPQGKQGTGAFQWNRSGWFGSQLGATLWLALLGAALLAQAKPVGGQLLLFAVIPNFVGFVLWRLRSRMSPYPAIQALIAVCGVSALCGMLCLRASSAVETLEGLPSIWFLLMYPGLMLMFCLQERSARANVA